MICFSVIQYIDIEITKNDGRSGEEKDSDILKFSVNGREMWVAGGGQVNRTGNDYFRAG